MSPFSMAFDFFLICNPQLHCGLQIYRKLRSLIQRNYLGKMSNIEEEKEFVVFDNVSFNFWCKQEPNEQDNQQLIEIFEREVIEKLRQNNSQ